MRLFLLILALTLAGRAWADGLPDLGEASSSAFSDKDERQVASEIMREIRNSREVLDDPEVTEYINNLGYRLVAASDDSKLNFEFFLVKDPTINAFALPGGFVGVHTGLITAAQNESELAGVLAHEIGHVTQKHFARQMANQQLLLIPSLAALAVAILAARSNPDIAQAAIVAAQAGAVQNSLDFTRDNEREADRTGMRTMVRADFDPQGMGTFFHRLQKADRSTDTASPAYLRTHPLTTERIADMQNRTAQTGYRQIPNSMEFDLVRSKVRVVDKGPEAATKFFESQLREERYADVNAARYGLVNALLAGHDLARAKAEFRKVEKAAPPHPMIQNLGAQIDLAGRSVDAAVARLERAHVEFPASRTLVYALADARLRRGDNESALALVRTNLGLYPDDYHLYALEARAQAQAGRRLAMHRAQAEAYVRMGLTAAAIEQLELGVKAGDGDFYQLSSAEARLKDLRALLPAKKGR